MYFRADGKNLVVVYKEFCFSACFTGRRILATAAFTHNANYAARSADSGLQGVLFTRCKHCA